MLLHLIVHSDDALTLRLHDPMTATQRNAHRRDKAFVMAPQGKRHQEAFSVCRSCGMHGLQERLDVSSAVLYTII